MIERNTPEIDVDDLMSRIQRDAARWQSGDAAGREFAFVGAQDLSSIEALLNEAAAKAEVRTRWSARIDFFFLRNRGVQRLLLRILAFVFRDQRHVNLALVAALRAFVVANRELGDRVEALENETHRLGSRLREFETKPE